ncbi:hypothetical protein COCSUDRAFT_83688 [Coccomyxa subellipsoidea C-169]|uniref:EXPERA domain-containing protein n=1 Tax=Coccomyxa subellipsoidea (strain C-169) TaxID=574566 RepID=I0YZJ4_COCSC|nr:hypothetical protein COCSUDRAFT_83688 [Coccomyxa subellipsoidea C-169]EIE23813.1 hypothetical protein COCSUDRAFT_83688 [Coccomyxa subellipsoidea C-169]|eukprot:XP_005648357.1 hypothetical protein COCSUDRAFT_83688 [Coccomyxa subellipsoidea C-169]
MAIKSLLSRPFDLLIFIFFLTHIPITIFIDSQSVLPRSWYADGAVNMLEWYVEQFGDPLVKDSPSWFRVLVWNEILLQLPFFFVGAYAFAAGKRWIRQPAIVYGVSTATTLLPILGELVLTPAKAGVRRTELILFYLPYLLVPLALAVRMLLVEDIFPQRPRRPVSRKRV